MRHVFMAVAVAVVAASCGSGGVIEATRTRSPAPTRTADASLRKADDFTLKTFEGGTFTLSDHFGELPVVLNFWAPW